MTSPVLPLKEKLKIIAGSLFLTLVIYLVIDLYVPVKKHFSGEQLSVSEWVAHFQFYKKAPFIALITFLMSRSTIKKRTKALEEAQTPDEKAVV